MNKIVREHYPVENLPEDLRALVPNASEVLLEITVANELPSETARPMTGAETAAMIRELHRKRAGGGRTMDEIVKEVRELRDEWDD
tara:strand:- start:10044 stop:10301 length:258 start_codon:yes stop_codon:yes gene_type:complete